MLSWAKYNLTLGILVLTALSLSSCGLLDPNHSKAPRFAVPPSTDRIQFIQSFPVTDQYGELRAPSAGSGPNSNPFAVMLAFQTDGNVVYCSASHITYNHVLTNAHCIEDNNNPADYFILYYNNQGALVYTTISNFAFQGSSDNFDVAILEIPDVAAQTWPFVQGTITSLSQAMRVMIWSFDPLKDHTDIASRYNQKNGMVFSPKSCLASRNTPQVIGYRNGSSETIDLGKVNTAYHIIMDNCDVVPISGNSGSLITMANSFTSLVGVFHWGNGLSHPESFSSFTYYGNAGQQQLNAVAGLEFFQVGSAFDYNPGIFR